MFTPNEFDLGYDPTITRVTQSDSSVRYDIAVRSASGEVHLYRTLSLEGDSGEHFLLGRGTRVWKARRLENGEEVGELVALKDTWVDDHRPREGYIYERMRSSATSAEDQKALEKIFLGISYSWS